jgi:PAS domain S-box-containing protein
MGTKEDKNTELIQQLTDENLIDKLSSKNQRDVLSIVFDAINSTVGGLIITNINGDICFANPSFCKMFEYKQEDIIDINAAELFLTKEVRKFSDVISIIDISKDETEEFIVQKSDGTNFYVEVSASNVTSATNQILGRMASFVDITLKKQIENDRENLISKLQNALDTIKTLKGIIPICSYCKKIRNDKGAWDQMEAYISAHSEAHFSHSVCPECYKKVMGEIE